MEQAVGFIGKQKKKLWIGFFCNKSPPQTEAPGQSSHHVVSPIHAHFIDWKILEVYFGLAE